MAEFPALPLWTDAYLADTRHLTTEQHGAYLLLLMEAWRRPSCSLPADDTLLARLSGLSPSQWAECRDVVMAFWTWDGRRKEWKQKRLFREREFVSNQRVSQKGRIAKRWSKTKNTLTGAIPDGYRSDTPTPTPTIETPNGVFPETVVSGSAPKASPGKRNSYPDEFEQAWKAYPTTTNMSKAEGHKAWVRLDVEDRAAVAKAIPGFVAYCKAHPDYPPIYFERFISKRRFDGFAGSTEPERQPTFDDWRKRLNYARDTRKWDEAAWGPAPNRPGSRVPPDLLQDGDGSGWLSPVAA